jgi:cytochrome c-type biogenesis protein CcmH
MKPRHILHLTFFILLFASGFLPSVVASAQQPTPSDDEVNAIARKLYCPVCENTPLDVCPTTACHQWRELIRQMLAEGKSEQEIKQYFVDYYGARVLSEPPRNGIYWLVYIVPPVAFLAGVYLLFRAFQTWNKTSKLPNTGVDPSLRSDSIAGTGAAEGDGFVTKFEEELRKRK